MKTRSVLHAGHTGHTGRTGRTGHTEQALQRKNLNPAGMLLLHAMIMMMILDCTCVYASESDLTSSSVALNDDRLEAHAADKLLAMRAQTDRYSYDDQIIRASRNLLPARKSN